MPRRPPFSAPGPGFSCVFARKPAPEGLEPPGKPGCHPNLAPRWLRLAAWLVSPAAATAPPLPPRGPAADPTASLAARAPPFAARPGPTRYHAPRRPRAGVPHRSRAACPRPRLPTRPSTRPAPRYTFPLCSAKVCAPGGGGSNLWERYAGDRAPLSREFSRNSGVGVSGPKRKNQPSFSGGCCYFREL